MVSGAGAVGLACAEPSTAGPVIGLALGSGAARGWAHLGVLQELALDGSGGASLSEHCSPGAFPQLTESARETKSPTSTIRSDRRAKVPILATTIKPRKSAPGNWCYKSGS